MLNTSLLSPARCAIQTTGERGNRTREQIMHVSVIQLQDAIVEESMVTPKRTFFSLRSFERVDVDPVPQNLDFIEPVRLDTTETGAPTDSRACRSGGLSGNLKWTCPVLTAGISEPCTASLQPKMECAPRVVARTLGACYGW